MSAASWIDLPCTVRLVRSDEDYEKVLDVRRRGYARILPPGTDVRDPCDRLPNAYIHLAEDEQGNPVGTIRWLCRRTGPIETTRYVDLSGYPDLEGCLEGTKYTIPLFSGSAATKLALWKAGIRLGMALKSPALMASARPSVRRDFASILFEDTGLTFIHPLDKRGRIHSVMRWDIPTAPARFKAKQHKLHDFFFVQENPQIRPLD